jgi:prophage regulatory protein
MSVRSNNELNNKSSPSKSPNDKYYNNTLEADQAPLVFLSKAQVLAKIPITAPTLWAWVRANRFPKPRAISPNKTVWFSQEVDEWMRSQPIRQYKP